MTERTLTTINNPILKDACELCWICKGQIIPSMIYEDSVVSIYESYFDRIWRWDPNEVFHRREGFDEAWEQFKKKLAEAS